MLAPFARLPGRRRTGTPIGAKLALFGIYTLVCFERALASVA